VQAPGKEYRQHDASRSTLKNSLFFRRATKEMARAIIIPSVARGTNRRIRSQVQIMNSVVSHNPKHAGRPKPGSTIPEGGPTIAEIQDCLEPIVRAFVSRRPPALRDQYGLTADDLRQEGYAHILRVLSCFQKERGTLRAWMTAVLHNRFVTLCRRVARGADSGVGTPAAVEEPVSVEPTPDQMAYVHELHAVIDDVCERLRADGYPADKIKAFRLRHLAGLKIESIASVVRRSLGWVSSAVHQCEEAFQSSLRESYPGIAEDFSR